MMTTKVFNFTDDEYDDNIHAFLMNVFHDFVKEEIEFDQKTQKPFAKLIFNSGEDEILFYTLPGNRLGWWDDNCGELLITEGEMDPAELLIELKKLVS